jgi:hypothetical protein
MAISIGFGINEDDKVPEYNGIKEAHPRVSKKRVSLRWIKQHPCETG